MKTDIVFPSGNEKKLADFGRKSGFERLIFVYSNLSDVEKGDFDLRIDYGVLVQEKNKNKLNKLIDKIRSKGFLVLIEAFIFFSESIISSCKSFPIVSLSSRETLASRKFLSISSLISLISFRSFVVSFSLEFSFTTFVSFDSSLFSFDKKSLLM